MELRKWLGAGGGSDGGGSGGGGGGGGGAPGLVPASADAGERGLAGVNLRYFALRAVIFGAVLAVVLLLGVGGPLAFALAIVISGLISYPLALRQRRTVVDIMENRRGGRR